MREAVSIQEQSHERVLKRVRAGVDAPAAEHASEVKVLEARIRLAEAEGDASEVVAHLTKMLGVLKEIRRLTAIRVEVKVESASALERHDIHIAEVTAELARAKAKLPPPRPAIAPFDAARAKEHQQAWASHLGVPVEFTNSLGAKFRLIPPGEFVMGNSDENPFAQPEDKPQHRVKLTKPFYLAEHETTVGEFRKFIHDTKRKTFAENDADGAFAAEPTGYHRRSGLNWQTPGFPQEDSHPVTCVTWEEANAFCEWLSKQENRTYRLPTDAQWEFACRAGTTTAYYYGLKADAKQAGIQRREEKLKTLPAGSFAANPFGLHDMLGNVYEWCLDGRRKYTPDLVTDPVGETGPKVDRVRRGGGWNSTLDQKGGAASGSRVVAPPQGDAAQTVGFRVAIVGDLMERSVPPTTPPKKDPGAK